MKKITFVSVICCALSACGGDGGEGSNDSVIRDYSEHFSALPTTTPYPEYNIYSDTKATLGELLFWDPILSGGENVSCASCHHPDFGWADGRNFSIGVDGVGLGPERFGNANTPIHAPTVANTAFTGYQVNTDVENFVSGPYFWDLRAETLEEQSIGPIINAIEMRGEEISEDDIYPLIEARLSMINEYQVLFEQAFPNEESITIDSVAKALATYQRTITGKNSRFDQFMAGDETVFTEREIIGLNVFVDSGCARCHSGPMLADNLIHQDQPVLRDFDAVRTPSLRNISATAPYMHTGELTTLRDAIAEYEDRDDLDVDFDDDDIGVVEDFLKTLDTLDLTQKIPDSVPSGLPVGGDIH